MNRCQVRKLRLKDIILACKLGLLYRGLGWRLGNSGDVDMSDILHGMDSSISSTGDHEGNLVVNDLFESFLRGKGRVRQVRGRQRRSRLRSKSEKAPFGLQSSEKLSSQLKRDSLFQLARGSLPYVLL